MSSVSLPPPPVKMPSLGSTTATSQCCPKKTVLNVTQQTTALALPSPTGSSSETSDYQRSTPSPRDEQDSGIGSLEEWSPESQPSRDETDLGFSEDLKEPLVPSLAVKSESADDLGPLKPDSTHIDPRLMLQQVRVALEKMPNLEKLKNVNDVPSTATSLSESCMKVLKRRHSDAPIEPNADVKKIKLEEESLPSQGKITSYMSETKHFTALRKEKLDRILNLKTEEITPAPLPAPTIPTKLDPEHHQNKNDLYLISQLKQLKDAKKADQLSSCLQSSLACNSNTSSSSVPQDLKSNNSSSVGSSTIGKAKDNNDCFEVPRSTIRFPLTKPSTPSSPRNTTPCKWKGCGEDLESTGKLIDHLKAFHVDCQNVEGNDEFQYKCLWEGCKVHGKSSSSRTWLEKHIMSHGGNKPFQCIVDGCKMRFSTQSLLERHVNGHFKCINPSSNQAHSGPSSNFSGSARHKSHDASSGSSTPLTSIVKSMRKAGRKLKYRQTIYSARIFDLFDLGMMAKMQEQIARLHCVCEKDLNISLQRNEITLEGEVVARKKDLSTGETMVLQSWKPDNFLPDEWTPLKSMETTKTLKLTSLPQSAKAFLSSQIQLQTNNEDTHLSRRKTRFPQQSSSALS
eukprot:snap_masked-scaffold408_size180710-processed-gene-0.13 protein:Tk05213 transcript:snap_masked-scaffold408_size180710-processed-gene-0.13-mRNA-1 annotation:"hypothetical protein L798_08557"